MKRTDCVGVEKGKRARKLAIFKVYERDNGYALMVYSGNYCGQVYGGMIWSWKVIEQSLTIEQAVELFKKKAKREV